MASARDAVNGFERLVTRSLAIVAIAVAAGATHSWMHGPLNSEPAITPPVTPTNGTNSTGTETDGPNGDPTGAEGQPVDDPPEDVTPTTVDLPEGHITTAQAYNHFINATADFIDARPAEEYVEGHIAGAFNLSLEMIPDSNRVNDVFQWLDKSRPIVVYCRGGLCSEAKDIGRLLNDAGFTQILIYHDGFPAWKAADYLAETGPGL